MNENEPHISASCGSDGEVHFEIIPRDKEIEERQKSQIQKVGPYCRVSTLSEQQETSYEQQRLHYTEYVERHPGWELVDIYADHGISATSTKRRKAFNRLIEDCKSGAVPYIITKQVSRFARNTADCVRICRELKKLDPPVAVYFETEGLNTLSPNSELYLTFMAALAQGESDAKSLSMKWAIRSRFERKIPRITRLYGFDRHKLDSAVALEPNGIRNALPHNKDIENVRMMYRWLLEGCNLSEIQNRLYTMKIPSPEGHPKWSTSSIRYVLSNEKYCGDIIMQKTFIEDVLDHKAVKNIGQERILGSIPLNQRLDEDAAKLGPWENMHLFQY